MKTGATSVVACLTTLAAVLMLGACGQKGPLHLPAAQPPATGASGASR